MKKKAVKHILLSIYHYFCFFLLMAFLVTCCMMLFLSTMSSRLGIVYTEENISAAAVFTFWNVVFLSFLCTVIDAVRRKIMVDRPVKKIVSAAERIAKGDYSVRIEPLKGINRADGLDQIVDCYNKMAEELSGVETLQTDFIANVSHELKTPLAIIQNYGALLQQPDLAEEERIRYAKAVSEASKRLANLVTDILKLNKLENQQIYPTIECFDLSEQLCECLLSFEQVWEEKEIEISTNIQPDVFLSADPELLSLVWNNLLSNAFKFTEIGGKVTLTLQEKEDSVIVEVIDTGCGITSDVGKRIFEKFYQADTSHATQGNGLGLALVKRVINILGGEIAVNSTPGKGTSFTVKIRRNDYVEENR